jgi:hypothetical protein
MPRFKKYLKQIGFVPFFIFLAMPASNNYQLKTYEFGGGGGSMDSNSYSLEAILGQQDSASMSSSLYNVRGGLIFAQMSNVPPAPSLTNPSNYYNKLLLVIDNGSNPSDTKFAVAISDDNWTTTRWVQSDNTVGNTLGTEDYQTYSSWGGASGENIIGLSPNKTYHVRVKAMQGEFTETQLGPQASATTSNPTLDFDIDVSSSDTETTAPYAVNFGSLSAGSVNTSSVKVWVDIATNGEAGGYVYISGANGGLKSDSSNYTITAVSGNLASLSEGFGAQNSTDSESSGGPLAAQSPFNGGSENVGIIDTTIRELYSTSGAPITGGRGSFVLKVKPAGNTPAGTDYTDTLTIISSATF